ncbi:MAG: hypothetical protein Q7U88_07065 [Desulfocapsaceae bacterium]|nr:hypothetical protein [Desulfocapsaceae bacterium]
MNISSRLSKLEQSRQERPVKIFFAKNNDETAESEALYPDHKLILLVRSD